MLPPPMEAMSVFFSPTQHARSGRRSSTAGSDRPRGVCPTSGHDHHPRHMHRLLGGPETDCALLLPPAFVLLFTTYQYSRYAMMASNTAPSTAPMEIPVIWTASKCSGRPRSGSVFFSTLSSVRRRRAQMWRTASPQVAGGGGEASDIYDGHARALYPIIIIGGTERKKWNAIRCRRGAAAATAGIAVWQRPPQQRRQGPPRTGRAGTAAYRCGVDRAPPSSSPLRRRSRRWHGRHAGRTPRPPVTARGGGGRGRRLCGARGVCGRPRAATPATVLRLASVLWNQR